MQKVSKRAVAAFRAGFRLVFTERSNAAHGNGGTIMSDAPTPVRLQLSRKKGFDLQALSLATNGLPAIVVTRGPGRKFGNPFKIKDAIAGNVKPEDARRSVVDAFKDWVTGGDAYWAGEGADIVRKHFLKNIHALRGKNLACTCGLDQPCHGDVLLRLAQPELFCEAI